jgi:hypothetical protein
MAGEVRVDLDTARMNVREAKRDICARLNLDAKLADRNREREFCIAVLQRLKDAKFTSDGADTIEKGGVS